MRLVRPARSAAPIRPREALVLGFLPDEVVPGTSAVEVTATGCPSCPDLSVARTDRAAAWQALREAGRAVEGYYGSPLIFVTRREDIDVILRDPRFERPQNLPSDGSPFTSRHRSILHKLMRPSNIVAALEQSSRRITERIRSLAQRNSVEAMDEFAYPLWTDLIIALIGLPQSAVNDRGEWEMGDAIRSRRARPDGSWLSQLIEACVNDVEVVGLYWLAWQAVGGISPLIGFCLLELARRPELRERVANSQHDRRRFIEEIMRLDPGFLTVERRATVPVTFAGVVIPAGTVLQLCVAAANREQPGGDELAMDEDRKPHWTFGGGRAHRCSGMYFARAILDMVVKEWLTCIPNFEVAPGHIPEVWYPQLVTRNADFHLRELPLMIDRARSLRRNDRVDLPSCTSA